MRLVGELKYTSEELEELREFAEEDNRFRITNPYEWLSYIATMILTVGVICISFPVLGYDFRITEVWSTVWAISIIIGYCVNFLFTRRLMSRAGYIKGNHLWRCKSFIKMIDMLEVIERNLPYLEDRSCVVSSDNKVLFIEMDGTGFRVTGAIKFNSEYLRRRIFREDGINADAINREIEHIIKKEAFHYLKNYENMAA
jgi:hypothetical protein